MTVAPCLWSFPEALVDPSRARDEPVSAPRRSRIARASSRFTTARVSTDAADSDDCVSVVKTDRSMDPAAFRGRVLRGPNITVLCLGERRAVANRVLSEPASHFSGTAFVAVARVICASRNANCLRTHSGGRAIRYWARSGRTAPLPRSVDKIGAKTLLHPDAVDDETDDVGGQLLRLAAAR